MASTIANYQGNGSTTDFNVPFDYLAKKFVKVTVDSREKLGGDYGDTTKDYFFVDKTTIRFNTAPASGTEIIIRRYTSATDRIVSFKDASVLKAKDLDVSTIQTIHIAEEGRDIINDALIVDKEGNWDAKGKRIVNVGDPIDDNDAITLKFYKDDAKGAYQAKLVAEAARDAAKISERNAKTSEVNAKESEVNSKASAGTAVSAAKHADTVMAENQAIIEEARQIQNNVETSESNAYENAVIATQQATLATTKAQEASDDADIAAQKAQEASASAANASASAEASEASATLSKASETASKTNADNAALSKDEATKQAERAKQYADQTVYGQVQADWSETVHTSKAFILNKPTLGTLASKNSIAYTEVTGTPDLSVYALGSTLTAELAKKANLSHTHTTAQITGLDTALAGKAPKSHTHTVSQITDFPSIPDASTLIPKEGNRGEVRGYETTGLSTGNLSWTSLESAYSSGGAITVLNGETKTAWTKVVRMLAGSVTLGSKWVWAGGSAPTIKFPGVLVCHWNNTGGIANYIAGAS